MTDSRLHSGVRLKAQELWVVGNSPGDRSIGRRSFAGVAMRLLRSFLMACAISGLSPAATAEPPIPINVRDYGATGDGVTDDTTAIQAALTAGSAGRKPVFFPSGVFRFTRALVGDGTTINCPSNNTTTLLFDDPSGTKDGMTIGHATFNMSGCNYDRKQAGTGGALIHFTDSYWSSIWNNRFDGPHAWNVVTIDSATFEPNQIFIHDNIVHNFINDFVFSNSQIAKFPVYDLHVYNNYSQSPGRAHYEMAGYGQLDAHDNAMTGLSCYDIYINTVNAPSINTLSQLFSNDLDTVSATCGGVSLYIANQSNPILTNNLLGAVTLIDVDGLQMNANSALCAQRCPWLFQGVTGAQIGTNKINGQNNPITIQPSGITKSQDLTFVGNQWLYSAGSFVTFSGGAPATDNVSISGTQLYGGEILATFTTPPTNFRNSGDTSGPGAAPTFATCTGVGATGSCTFSPGATNEFGTISLNTAGSGEASTGIVKVTYSAAVGPLGSSCALTLQNSSGFWVPPVSVIQDGTTPTTMQFHWVNGSRTALTDRAQYNIEYNCRGF
jgi:hypothetical protein